MNYKLNSLSPELKKYRDRIDINWGCDGAAQFFICESELQQLDFRDVYYHLLRPRF
jgi:uncharacterized protein YwqG